VGGQEEWEGRRPGGAGEVGEQEECECRRRGRQEEWDDHKEISLAHSASQTKHTVQQG
jgi:hypothetical protein